MDSGFYAACTALLARSQALDMVANNLANISTPGYRAQHNLFRSVLASSSAGPISNLNYAINNYSVLGGSQLDLSEGTMTKTGGDLDFAVQGSGFFAVQTASGQVFTRNGNFHISSQGKLVTSQGDPVLGDDGPISIVGAPVSVSPDGTISVNGAVAGKLKVVDFPAGTSLESLGQTYYSAPPKCPARDSSEHSARSVGKLQRESRFERGGIGNCAALCRTHAACSVSFSHGHESGGCTGITPSS